MELIVDPTWKIPKGPPNISVYVHCKDNLGAKLLAVTGGIGHTGQKVHRLIITYVELENGKIGLCDVFNSCGSAKFQSITTPYFDTDLSSVNCKKCLR